MPIYLAPINRELTVIRIAADAKTKQHLENLGILPKSKLTVLSSINGTVICVCKGIRLALDSKIARSIFIG